ncbi:hypothetical protein A4E84_21490 [Streptomyces qaidamensis]|uniref:Uncharacterized protein n=2 Tax=Streptomyces qaidamensis TaxID=1783515 RepID=A0A143C2X3_9ACTN|nr:hypothetical protein A4E84_21490 [Streptomyces qaidamensis]
MAVVTCEMDHPFGLSMVERHGGKVDLAALLEHTRDLHPREAALHETQRHTSSGADTGRASAARERHQP